VTPDQAQRDQAQRDQAQREQQQRQQAGVVPGTEARLQPADGAAQQAKTPEQQRLEALRAKLRQQATAGPNARPGERNPQAGAGADGQGERDAQGRPVTPAGAADGPTGPQRDKAAAQTKESLTDASSRPQTTHPDGQGADPSKDPSKDAKVAAEV